MVKNRIAVLGGGESGVGAAVLAKVKGFDVFLSDMSTLTSAYKKVLNKYDIPFEEGGHTWENILNADEIIKSPGIPSTAPLVAKAIDMGIPVISEIEFAGRYDTAKKICITGSNGKTTTTSLIYYMLKNVGLNVGLGGNIGRSYAYQVATEHYDIYVLELSSFQLDNMYDFKADIAILLNITPDHLDRYGYDLQNYVNAKFRITQNMAAEDCFIFCSDDEITIKNLNQIVIKAQMLPISQEKEVEIGAYTLGGRMHVNYGGDPYEMPVADLSLQGRHNVYNTMAAALTGKLMNIKNESIRKALTSFMPVEHRMEKVLSVRGVLYVNDSKATNVNSTWYALECMTTPVVLILGGKDKGNDYSALFDLVREKVKAIVCLGVDNTKIHAAFDDKVATIVDTASAVEAVKQASMLAKEGDTVLLSPCCASFDLFKSYEDRGQQFKEAVRNL
ncbi:MAG: UDP-N-acetylmuramoyl-L-alanine--D-glutamate ligase [Bacteroidales bacterium]|nr:UDP-N-acetylmuramoyl-L-alanine--D-glutamate ligase [Bacteroidales bacterium]